MTEIRSPRDIPSVETVTAQCEKVESLANIPRTVLVAAVQAVVETLRSQLQKKSISFTMKQIQKRVVDAVRSSHASQLRRVINATGIVVHTNLGRSPLASHLLVDIEPLLTGYSNVEFDLETGARGKRGEMVESYLAQLSTAEAGTVVNNNAAALFMILNTFAARKEVVISRGELVQIGGGFRIPDILSRAGAKLVEVGTTNITTLADYENGITAKTAMILKVHKSNFTQTGFTKDVAIPELVPLARKHQCLLVNDLGSGLFFSTKQLLGYEEPTVQRSVSDGADLTCFSGDKMLGGVQAGLIVGKQELVSKIKKNPLFRAMRVDKITFAVLERLLASYLNGSHTTDIAVWSMLSIPEAELYKRAKAMVKSAGEPKGVSVEATKAYLGGGAMPEEAIPSVAIIFASTFSATALQKKFRNHAIPIIGRIEAGRFMLDIKAVALSDDAVLIEAIRAAVA